MNLKNNAKEQANAKYEEVIKDFPDLKSDIKYLIRYRSQKFVIFIDWNNGFGWETADSMDEIMTSEEMNIALSEIEQLINQPCVKYFDSRKKKELYVLIGSAMAYALGQDYNVARVCREKAAQYIDARKYEITREWQLFFCIGLLGICSILFLFLNRFVKDICGFFALNLEEFRRALFCFWGIVGASFSIIQSAGKTFYDCQSGRLLSFLQIFSKILAGAISGIIVIYLFEMGLIFNNFKGTAPNACLVILCIIAGFSERLVPSIMDKFCEDEIGGNNKRRDADISGSSSGNSVE